VGEQVGILPLTTPPERRPAAEPAILFEALLEMLSQDRMFEVATARETVPVGKFSLLQGFPNPRYT